jgi:BirA family transcriptional regulator, biotin operon repressor / biotin---[acetyl-CoA-carboxylase] ligase
MTLDAQILSSLRETDGGSVSGTDLSQKLGISRTAVWARIEELRGLGYEISASPHQGYRLMHVPDVLHADDLLARLPRKQIIGRGIHVFEETTSTSDVVEKLARDGVKEGVVVFAESQTKGRGRLGRKWVSPARKGLWFSILLRPRLRPQDATQLTVASGIALLRGIRGHTGIEAVIKWPNDILIGGRKVAGILTELSAELDQVKYVILGIGVDVNLNASDFTPELRKIATSLKIETGKSIASRAELAIRILCELEQDYARLRAGKFLEVAEEWEKNCATIGQRIVVKLGGRSVRGTAESLGEDGTLLVRTEHGHLEKIAGGEISVES